MIDKRLFQLVEKKSLILLILFRVLGLGLMISLWFIFAQQLTQYLEGGSVDWLRLVGIVLLVLVGKAILTKLAEKQIYQASAELRLSMRRAVMAKAFRLGNSEGQLPASTLTQLTVDGIEQLEIYYSRFLPQLFYCLIASLMIFGSLVGFAWQPAIVLLICMPMIPVVIMAVMKIAKRILSGYWSDYTNLGSKFHENLSGLSILKAYDQDKYKQEEIVSDAERFRKATMSLLSMQLNSITIMDIISYSGAALGIGMSLIMFTNGDISLTGMLMFLLLSAEFFIPMRQLGSLFHVAMNGISACSKLFAYLELKEQVYGEVELEKSLEKIEVRDLTFTYEKEETTALYEVSAIFSKGSFSALVGKSGSGKSTFVRVLLNQLPGYQGEINWNDVPLSDLNGETIRKQGVLVDNHGYLYANSIQENLLIGYSHASETDLWNVLEQVSLADFVRNLPEQLNTLLEENGSNLSGGQRQRLLLARALLREAELYVFDEITSGVDLESEKIILGVLQKLAQEKIVLFISHRLYNVLAADQVLVFEAGKLVEVASPEQLQQESYYFKNYFLEEEALLKGGA
ncbi:ABC transporter ATP-binding protein/permease [Listeria monocytogenes]|uniref:ABC transporter ATP-binding protein/permease n=1 Tax=Listeria monocytogenes TaxID=1639 RepID=UPI00085C59C4|nr:ABC transporter ATP-binding protein/permease [Listeria monocytogenes]EAD7631534.1 ABC transporter ATP-binding protein/permease [Listeria monocytogenes]EAG9489585.1 ABC transporter ATP-binding protein/permease [Listeria monocytogenes]EFQ9068490.1 ABC transporter ATP-binding protein/permease [Listeria monocytogenes]MCR59202.1 ABC transporter ATP-binding protein/permease [Listeria monocytogenes]OET95096.1 ABC transporter ATP-binding protein [Listeria monocytogenes]